MSKLELKENKKLVLKQVLVKELKNIEIDNIDKEIFKFANQLKQFNVQVFGPLIKKTLGTTVHDDGRITMDYELMVQAHNYKKFTKIFTVKERVESENCVFLRYKGKPNDIHFAISKLELHFFEKDLVSNGVLFEIIISESAEQVVVDFFKPVVSL